jgi:thiamine-phosphate diphosphorylase
VSPRSNLAALAPRPILCYVTDRHTLPRSSDENSIAALARRIAEVATAGVHWIQIREKELCAKELSLLTREALRAVQWHRLQPVEASPSDSKQQNTSRVVSHARIIVNDRLDVAIAERADGVHLGENSIPPAAARRLIQTAQEKKIIAEHFIVGVSCHSLVSAKAAEAAGADYIYFGPIFPTPSKGTYGEPQGLARLAEVCCTLSIPVLAIGGISEANARNCLDSGAAGIAAIRLFQDTTNLASVTQAPAFRMKVRR